MKILNEIKLNSYIPFLPKQIQKDVTSYNEVKNLLNQYDVCLMAHYYTPSHIQQLAQETGGFIGDSLEMAKKGAECSNKTLCIAGVRFMGETSKILSPEKKVLLPNLQSECTLDLHCNEEQLIKIKQKYPEALVVSYANTSARIKALSDYVVTSSIAVKVIKHLKSLNKKILWISDRNLGSYLSSVNDCADFISWPGFCAIHDSFDLDALKSLKLKYPQAQCVVHPESRGEIVKCADFVGSTSQIIKFCQASASKSFIVVTERNIEYALKQNCPDKEFIVLPLQKDNPLGLKAQCPWMQLNTLDSIKDAILNPQRHEVILDPQIMNQARHALERMFDFI